MILLDTHTLLWAFFQKNNLPEHTRNIIEEAETVYVSVASLWEIAIKQSIGKLDLNCTIADIVQICNEEGIEILQITAQHLDQIKQLPSPHNDPFDRLIISQAMVEDLTIISKDRFFDKYDIKLVWENE